MASLCIPYILLQTAVCTVATQVCVRTVVMLHLKLLEGVFSGHSPHPEALIL